MGHTFQALVIQKFSQVLQILADPVAISRKLDLQARCPRLKEALSIFTYFSCKYTTLGYY